MERPPTEEILVKLIFGATALLFVRKVRESLSELVALGEIHPVVGDLGEGVALFGRSALLSLAQTFLCALMTITDFVA
jgi:hypothetical protein